MDPIKWHIYTPPHSKTNFYQKMGKFFSEKIYQQKLPYLTNSNQTFWIILENNQKDIIGFSSFELTKKGVEIGDIYLTTENHELWVKLASKTIREAKKFQIPILYSAVNSEKQLKFFLYKGFKIYKKTKHYFFIQMEVFSIEK